MPQRKILPVFMLPAFDGQENIYVIYSGDFPSNLKIRSAREFRVIDMRAIGSGRVQTVKDFSYRVDNVADTNVVLEDLAKQNDGVVDYTLALEQGQRLARRVMGLINSGSLGEILSCGADGRLTTVPYKE